MSFILDALKKAESERNRQSGPVLMDVRIAPPRRRLPTWAWVLGIVLLANLGVLAYLLLRTPPRDESAALPVPTVAPATVAVAPPAATSPVTAPATAATPAAMPPGPAGADATTPAAMPMNPATVQPPPAAADIDQLPTVQDLLASGVTLPTLQLNLHVFDASPANRYVLLNAVRLREGEFTPDGIKVEQITARGVVLEARGRRFLLIAGG